MVNTVSEIVSFWTRELNISVPTNTGVPFQVYHYIYICWGICQDQKNNATLRRVITFFKVIITLTLKEFCFRVKTIHHQDTTKSTITKTKFQ